MALNGHPLIDVPRQSPGRRRGARALGNSRAAVALAVIAAGAVASLCSPVGFAGAGAEAAGQPGRLVLTILEAVAQQPLPARVHLKDAAGQAHKPTGYAFWHDHFACDGRAELSLAAGEYRYEIERGPEFTAVKGSVSVRSSESTNLTARLERLVDLASEGWWSGDLHVHRPAADAELLMRAEDLHVAQFITWWNQRNPWETNPVPVSALRQIDGNRFYHVLAGEDEREGGALLYFNLQRPLAITQATRDYPSSVVYAEAARKVGGVWIDMEKPFWWDLPLWVAAGAGDSLGVANNHMCRSSMLDNEAWGRPRDRQRFPAPRGNGLWTQEIYYRLLNCGLRIPPSAGSASGVLPNPPGYNRVYVHVEAPFTYEKWFENLRAGHCFVGNGPLLRVRANGKPPGAVFSRAEGDNPAVEIEARLTSRDPVANLEILYNGRVARSVPVESGGPVQHLGKLALNESGWFLVRAVADVPHTFRFASTGPFNVDVGGKTRISKSSAQFFLDWVREGMKRVKVQDESQRQEVLHYHRLAERYWEKKVREANAE